MPTMVETIKALNEAHADGFRAGLEAAAKVCRGLVGKYPAWDNDDVCLHLEHAIRALAAPADEQAAER